MVRYCIISMHCVTRYCTELYTMDFHYFASDGRVPVVFAFTRGLVEIEARVPGVRAQLGEATRHLHPLPLVEDGRAALVV